MTQSEKLLHEIKTYRHLFLDSALEKTKEAGQKLTELRLNYHQYSASDKKQIDEKTISFNARNKNLNDLEHMFTSMEFFLRDYGFQKKDAEAFIAITSIFKRLENFLALDDVKRDAIEVVLNRGQTQVLLMLTESFHQVYENFLVLNRSECAHLEKILNFVRDQETPDDIKFSIYMFSQKLKHE